MYNLRLITFSSTLRCDQISNDEILLSIDPSQKQEVNRKAFAKFDKDHSGSRTATAAAESDPTVRYNGKVTLSTCQQYMKVSCTLEFKRSFYHSKLRLNVNFSWTVSSLFKSIAHFLLELHSKRGEDGGYDYVNLGSYM